MVSLEVGCKRGAAIVVALVAALPASASSQLSPTSEEQRRVVGEFPRSTPAVVRYYVNDGQR
jgi:hypothetical protein